MAFLPLLVVATEVVAIARFHCLLRLLRHHLLESVGQRRTTEMPWVAKFENFWTCPLQLHLTPDGVRRLYAAISPPRPPSA